MIQAGNVTKEMILVGTYDDETRAQRAVERLIERGFPMDMLSVLGRVHAAGDDVLGIYYSGEKERIQAWAKQGAIWGGLWGLLAGAAGLFVLPGIGPIFVAGPIVEAIVGALGGAAAMTGAAAVTHLATAMHRMGIPEEKLDELHRIIEEGHYLLLLRGARSEIQEWKSILEWSGAREVMELPFH